MRAAVVIAVRRAALAVRHADRRPFRPIQFAEAALRLRRKLADGVDVVAEQFQTVRRLGVGRVDVEDAAATAELAGQLDGLRVLVAVGNEPGGHFLHVHGFAAAEDATAGRELGACGDRLEQRLDGGQHQARRFDGIELFQETQTPADGLVHRLPGDGLIVAGGEKRGAKAGEADQIAGPRIDFVGVGDDDEQGSRGEQGQGRGGQTGGRTPGAVHDAAAAVAQGGEQRVEALGGL